MESPFITIILPTYDGAKWIKQAIESVLVQTFTGWELLIIDDGSTDNTKEIVDIFAKNDSRIRYIKNETNLGIQKTLNRGLKEAQGEYIARIDDDDIWTNKDKLKIQLEFLKNNEDYVLVGTGAIMVDENKKELSRFIMPEKDVDIRNKILSKNCFVHSSVMFKKEAALSVGGYDEALSVRHIEDYDLWLKIGTVGKLENLNIYGVSLMQRSDTISNKNRIVQARRSISKIFKFKNKYPNFFTGYLLNIIKLFFFLIQKIIPLNNKFIYKIKIIYKEL